MKAVFIGLLIILMVFSLSQRATAATLTEGVAHSIAINDSNAVDGDIISSTEKGFVRTNKEYDSQMYGVISDNPAVSIENQGLVNGRLVVNNGITNVRVFTKNGKIKNGDFLTSSDTAGVAQKANKSGYILGVALADFSSDNPAEIGTIQASLNIRFNSSFTTRTNLVESVRLGIEAPFLTPLGSLRYLLAAIIAVLSFALAFGSFGRVARTGVEALGRNPMASKIIEITVVINVVLTISIMLVGLFVAYLILTI